MIFLCSFSFCCRKQIIIEEQPRNKMGSAPSTSNSSVKEHKGRRSIDSSNPKYRQYTHDELVIDEQDLRSIKEIMNTHSVLCYLPEDIKEICIGKIKKWKYSGGYYIYRQHDIAASLYLIKDGGVYVQIDCNIVKTLTKGEYFGHDTLCFQSLRSESIRVASHELIMYQLKKEEILPIIQGQMSHYKQKICTLFSRIHFFNYLTNKEKEFIIKSTFLFVVNDNQTIFEKEQIANSFYVVQKGSVKIEIPGRKDLVMKEGEYFGEAAFFSIEGNGMKCQRKGRACSNEEGTEVYGVGISKLKQNLGHQMRSIIFYNQQKWAIYRDPFLSTMTNIDVNYLLQLFNVKEGRKFTILASKKTKPKYLFIPLEVQINKETQFKLYCSEYLKEENRGKVLSEDIILTEGGYYAYALIDQFKQVLSLHKDSVSQREINIKLDKQPIYKVLTLSIRNISKYSKKIPSSQYSTVLIVQDMKFGGEFILKIYKKKKSSRQMTAIPSSGKLPQVHKVSRFKTVKIMNQQSMTSLPEGISRREIDKQLESQFDQLPVEVALAEREKEIMNSLNSPYICGFYKGQQDENHFYLFIQHIVGQTLEEIMLQFGTVPQSVLKYFLASIATALHYLHSKNIIYRNINPSNIIVKTSGHLVLTDFSCSKRINSGRTNSIAGVPYYMAPEVIEQKEYTFNADLWSMGVILYEMMSGSLPFGQGANNIMQIYQSILDNELNLKKIGNKNAKTLISALLHKDPNLRIATALEIRKYLYMNDIQFDWNSLLKQKMEPFYFPIKRSFNYINFNNCELFDASTIQEFQ